MCQNCRGCSFPKADNTEPCFRVAEIATCSSVAVKSKAVNDFLDGKLAGVRYHSFLTPEQAAVHAVAAHVYGFQRYESAPEVGKIGVALVDAPALNAYLALAEMMRRPHDAFANSDVLLSAVVAFLSLSSGRKFELLTRNGRAFHAGNWRLLTGGAGIHLDLISDDCQQLKNLQVEFQGSFVLHIETSGLGGETTVYNRRGSEADKADPLYVASGWKYSPAVVEGIEKVVVPAVTGDLLLLPTQLYHSVAPSSASGRERISFSAFLLKLKGDETVYYYS